MKIIQIKVKAKSRGSELIEAEAGGAWTAHIKSPPVDGKANQELIGLLASHFSCPKKVISIQHGCRGRDKLIHIDLN